MTSDLDARVAALLLRAFVSFTDDVPSIGACYLLNAALHVEGRGWTIAPNAHSASFDPQDGEVLDWYCTVCRIVNGAADVRCVNCNRRDAARDPACVRDDGSLPGGAYVDRDPDEWEIDARMAQAYADPPPVCLGCARPVHACNCRAEVTHD